LLKVRADFVHVDVTNRVAAIDSLGLLGGAGRCGGGSDRHRRDDDNDDGNSNG
jgi:hypothetical protein